MSYINIGIRRPLALGADALPMDVYLLILKSLRDVQALVKCKEVSLTPYCSPTSP